MSNLLELRENIKRIYGKYEIYITPVLKFLLTLVAILMINTELGYMSILKNVFVVLMASLACAVLPWGFSLAISALFIVGHIYAMAMECAIVAVAIFALMFLLYFRFTYMYQGMTHQVGMVSPQRTLYQSHLSLLSDYLQGLRFFGRNLLRDTETLVPVLSFPDYQVQALIGCKPSESLY